VKEEIINMCLYLFTNHVHLLNMQTTGYSSVKLKVHFHKTFGTE